MIELKVGEKATVFDKKVICAKQNNNPPCGTCVFDNHSYYDARCEKIACTYNERVDRENVVLVELRE